MKVSKILSVLLIALLITVMILPTAFAMGAIDVGEIDISKECSLKIKYNDKGEPIDGAIFSIYKVAEVDDYGRIYVTDDFAAYNVNLLELDSEGLRDTAFTLEGLVDRDGIMPVSSGMTDRNGVLTFPNNSNTLEVGVYLIVGRLCFHGEMQYIPDPILISLPIYNKTNDRYDYNATIVPKYESFSLGSEKETVDCTIIKVWTDGEDFAEIPDEVSVVLLKDGELYDRVTLNRANNWRYTWEKLDAGHSWVAVEDDMIDFEVLVHREGNTIVVNNTYIGVPPDDPPETEPSEPEDTTRPRTTEPTTPGHTDPTNPPPTTNPGNTEPTTTPGNNPPERLPQTGVLWWPVYACSFAGMILFIIGWGVARKNEYT